MSTLADNINPEHTITWREWHDAHHDAMRQFELETLTLDERRERRTRNDDYTGRRSDWEDLAS